MLILEHYPYLNKKKIQTMKSFSLAIIFGLIAATQAQSIEELPECSRPCVYGSVASQTNCAPDDFGCLCADDNLKKIQSDGANCVLTNCGAQTAFSE